MNLDVSAKEVKAILRRTWRASEDLKGFRARQTQTLAAQKYSTDTWNMKF